MMAVGRKSKTILEEQYKMNKFSVIIFLVLLVNYCSGLNSEEFEQNVLTCSRQLNIEECLKERLVRMINTVAYLGPDRIPVLGEYVTLERNQEFVNDTVHSDETTREMHDTSLTQQVIDAGLNVLKSRNVNIKIPQDWYLEEGRGKKKYFKKYVVPLLFAGFILKATLMPIIVGKVSLIAGKALLVSMMALLLGLSINFKKSGGGRKHEEVKVINLDPHDKHRRQDDDSTAHELAYSAYTPEAMNKDYIRKSDEETSQEEVQEMPSNLKNHRLTSEEDENIRIPYRRQPTRHTANHIPLHSYEYDPNNSHYYQ